MSEIAEYVCAYEWAEYNLPAELSSSAISVTPLARALFAQADKPVETRMAWPFDLTRTPRLRVGVVSELLLSARFLRS
jgi:hypothetical protein